MIFPTSKYGWGAIASYLLLILITVAHSAVWYSYYPCVGEWCAILPTINIALFSVVFLQNILGNQYWFFGSGIINCRGFILNLIIVYWIGGRVGKLFQKTK